ncbi:uncharacterized protein K02A2.6-like [Agrilus planipennis]|uniref:Uncharacterized protein K02A2.6-like n=1 Tax=Agrilus planipennis TaxID=224129 RepID=A0A7F5R640_AGRPL|nr:uncharacterized protein K02A2.6-like [Agrilus planipennis]
MSEITSNTLQIEFFNSEVITWTRWVKRFEGAFTLASWDQGLKAKALLHYIGNAVYNTLCDKSGADDPYTMTYDVICTKLKELYEPTVLEIAESYRFYTRKQEQGESVQAYANALNKLSVNCDFKEHAKRALRDQFVIGLADKRTQNRLLETKNPTFESALQTAVSMELTSKEFSAMTQSTVTVDLLHKKYKKRNNTGYSQPNKKYNSDGKNDKPSGDKQVQCYRCGGSHYPKNCKLSSKIKCRFCGKLGHVEKVCFKKKTNTDEVNYQGAASDSDSDCEEYWPLCVLEELSPNADQVHSVKHALSGGKIYCLVSVNSVKVKFEVDTGAAVTIMNADQAKRILSVSSACVKLYKSDLHLVSYCKTPINVLGYVTVDVVFKNSKFTLNLYVTDVQRDPLLGREWVMQFIKCEGADAIFDSVLAVEEAANVDVNAEVKQLLHKYKNVLSTDMTEIEGFKASLTLREGAKGVFLRARPLPFALIKPVEDKLKVLIKQGILVRVDTSIWATPIVPIMKKDGSIRLCGDYSVSVNPQLIICEHPLPTIDELLTDLPNCIAFAIFDVKNAYLQAGVTPETAEILTLNTSLGLLQPTRLMFGVASAPAIRQQFMDSKLKHLKGVKVFQDDIRIAAKSITEFLQTVDKVLKFLHDCNVKINVEKSKFYAKSIKYCGYVIDGDGVHKDKAKFDAIVNMPRPTNVTEVRAFCGMINFYSRFIKDASTILHPLNQLLCNNNKFEWKEPQEVAFQRAKEAFVSNKVLQFFDPSVPLVLATDASPAERFVQTIKKALAKIPAKSNIQYELQEILTQYRNMPHAQTGLSPAEMVFNRKIRGRLDLLKQTRRKDCNIDKDSRTFKEGERVIAREYVGKTKWKFGTVKKRTGKLHYRVRTDCGQDWRRHTNQLRRTGVQLALHVNEFDYYIPPEERIQVLRTDENAPQAHEEQPDNVATYRAVESAEAQDNMTELVQLAAPPALQRRNLLRKRRRPEKLHDYIVDVSPDEVEDPVEDLHSFNID